MITIVYDPEFGKALPDAEVKKWAIEAFKAHHAELRIGCELMLAAVRATGLKHYPDKYKDFRVRFYDEYGMNEMYFDKNWNLDRWPKGFCDYYDGFLDELIFKRD